jgi:hypothetical protein
MTGQLQRLSKIALGIFVFAVLSVSTAHSQTIRYIRAGATGSNNGSDWTNAYTELNKVGFSSGMTIYVAAGTYNTGFPQLSTGNVTIKRATLVDHGTATGWNNTYDGQVTVTSSASKFLYVSGGSGFTFDGGHDSSGWKFTVQGQVSYNGRFQIESTSNTTVRGIELDGQGCEPAVEAGPEDGFRLLGNTNIVLESVYVHDFWYCSYSNVGNPGHSDGIQMPSANGAEIRYSLFKNNGMLLFFGDCAWGNQWANNVKVHHNVFIQQAGVANNYRIMDMKGAGQTSNDYVRIENNTFYRDSSFSGQTLYENTDCPANTSQRSIKNNIFVNGNFGLSSGWGTHSNNDYFGGTTQSETGGLSVDPKFVSASTLNFHLQSTSPVIDKGTNLGYTLDVDGTTVPQNGSPDMGAYEYGSSSTTGPAAPTNLTATVN